MTAAGEQPDETKREVESAGWRSAAPVCNLGPGCEAWAAGGGIGGGRDTHQGRDLRGASAERWAVDDVSVRWCGGGTGVDEVGGARISGCAASRAQGTDQKGKRWQRGVGFTKNGLREEWKSQDWRTRK